MLQGFPHPFIKNVEERGRGERERIRERKAHTRTLTLQSLQSRCGELVWIKFNSPPLSSFQVHGRGGSERRRRRKRRCFWFSLGPIFLSFFSVLSGGSDMIPGKCNVAQASGGMGRCRLARHASPHEEEEDRERERERVVFIRCPLTCLCECGRKCCSAMNVKAAGVSICASVFVHIYTPQCKLEPGSSAFPWTCDMHNFTYMTTSIIQH